MPEPGVSRPARTPRAESAARRPVPIGPRRPTGPGPQRFPLQPLTVRHSDVGGRCHNAPMTADRFPAAAPVVVIGHSHIDEFLEPSGEGRVDSVTSVGGSALNVATAVAHLGLDCVLVTSIGADVDGDRIREHAERRGFRILASTNRHGTGREVFDQASRGGHDGEFNGASRARGIRFDDEQSAAISAARVVIVSGYALDDRKQHRRLLDAVRQPQNRLLLDPNPRAGLVRDLELFRENFERHASSALLVHIAERDADLVFDSPIDEVTSDLLDIGARNVLATQGEGDSRWVNRSGVDVSHPVVDLPGEIVDRVGGGDAAFAAAAAWIVRRGVPQSDDEASDLLAEAMRLAATVVRQPGSPLALSELAFVESETDVGGAEANTALGSEGGSETDTGTAAPPPDGAPSPGDSAARGGEPAAPAAPAPAAPAVGGGEEARAAPIGL